MMIQGLSGYGSREVFCVKNDKYLEVPRARMRVIIIKVFLKEGTFHDQGYYR